MEIERITVELITIRVGNARIEVTPAQARELYEVLGRLFNDNRTVYAPMIVPMPAPSYLFVPSTTWRFTSGGTGGDYVSVGQTEVIGAG